MALAAYFTAHGFLFLTYDATGTDNSEGQNCAGLEQGVIDLSRVIDYARNDPEVRGPGTSLYLLYGRRPGLHPPVLDGGQCGSD